MSLSSSSFEVTKLVLQILDRMVVEPAVLPSSQGSGPATARVLRAKCTASNPLALPARVPAYQHKPRRSVRSGAGRRARVLPKGAARLWHSQGLLAGR